MDQPIDLPQQVLACAAAAPETRGENRPRDRYQKSKCQKEMQTTPYVPFAKALSDPLPSAPFQYEVAGFQDIRIPKEAKSQTRAMRCQSESTTKKSRKHANAAARPASGAVQGDDSSARKLR